MSDDQKDPVVLYTLTRTDLLSMNSGKAAAHATHAGNKMTFDARRRLAVRLPAGADAAEAVRLREFQSRLQLDLDTWEAEGGGFGTTIALDAPKGLAQLQAVVKRAEALHLHCGLVVDREYPVYDGGLTHLIAMTTAAYVFGPKSMAGLATLGLHLLRDKAFDPNRFSI